MNIARNLGFGKDVRDQDREGHPDIEKEGREGQTEENNVDPARNQVNPQVLSREDYLRNSMLYGMKIPTGATSTWDREITAETNAFLQRLPTDYEARSVEHHGMTSINNFLAGEVAGTGEGPAYEAGRQRGMDAQEPAHHFDFHEPTTHDRLHGAANIVAGKIRMDQDIETRGQAEYHGQTGDGH